MDLAEAGARLFPHLAPQATATVAAKPDVQPATATAAAKVTADPATATADAQADFGAAARRMYPHLAVQDVAAAKVAELAGPKPADQVAKVAPPVAPPVAPYALKAPEGQTFDAMVIDSYAKVAQELRLPQDQAQKVLDQVVPVMKARTLARIEAARADWLAQSKADAEFGGGDYDQNRAAGERVLSTLGTVELRALLKDSGLRDHPEFQRLLHRLGRELHL